MTGLELPDEILVIDSHTGGEPTRVIVQGGPDLGLGSLVERRETFRQKFDVFRRAVMNEPRGSDVIVGALLCPPVDPRCCCGTIYFNNAGFIGMCGHGTIGLMVTLHHLGRIQPGVHSIETPVGVVQAHLHDRHTVTVENVPSFRSAQDVAVEVPGLGRFVGDIAWGGNWFFLVKEHAETIAPDRIERLLEVTRRIRTALIVQKIFAPDGSELDHIEMFGPADPAIADSRNFVLCPGGAYDRSPCGTGTSAKLACLAAEGRLAAGAIWRQQSVIGSVFECRYRRVGDQILPSLTGQAFVSGENRLLFDRADPFREGLSQ